ncbi:MAG TPA: hypothetical protein DEW46_08740 [Verrucomicrobia bacterium]|nr:hypothetical protein [Verrucomicrobiota bacterium]
MQRIQSAVAMGGLDDALEDPVCVVAPGLGVIAADRTWDEVHIGRPEDDIVGGDEVESDQGFEQPWGEWAVVLLDSLESFIGIA